MSDVLSLVIPTYNEKKSLQHLLPRLDSVSRSLRAPVEFIVVDDNSPDGTANYAQIYPSSSAATVRVVRREGKFGRTSAVIEGWRCARGSILGVMDADGAHDESVLPELLEAVVKGPAEVAVGSRYVQGGGSENRTLASRLISLLGVLLARFICPANDSTSGYLLFRREVLEGVSMNPAGHRIGLEVMVRGRYRTFTEVPYVHRPRAEGAKLDPMEMFCYLQQLTNLISYRYRHPHQRRRWTRVVS